VVWFGSLGSVVAISGALTGDQLPPPWRACTVNVYVVSAGSGATMIDVSDLPELSTPPFMVT
jgi:hypothetical protein